MGTPCPRVVRQTLDKHWTDNPIFVKSLSNLCQKSVQVQGLSVLCQREVRCLSKLCLEKVSSDTNWTWKSKLCPSIVQQNHLWTLPKVLNKTKFRQTFDANQLWTDSECRQTLNKLWISKLVAHYPLPIGQTLDKLWSWISSPQNNLPPRSGPFQVPILNTIFQCLTHKPTLGPHLTQYTRPSHCPPLDQVAYSRPRPGPSFVHVQCLSTVSQMSQG